MKCKIGGGQRKPSFGFGVFILFLVALEASPLVAQDDTFFKPGPEHVVAAAHLLFLQDEDLILKRFRAIAIYAEPSTRFAFYQEVLAAARSVLNETGRTRTRRRARLALCGSRRCRPAAYGSTGCLITGAEFEALIEESGPAEDVIPPQRISGSQPAYSEAARQGLVEGVVRLCFRVDEKGEVANITVVDGLPLGLSEEAVKAVRQWRYRPALRDGNPVAVAFRQSVNFRLTEDPRSFR